MAPAGLSTPQDNSSRWPPSTEDPLVVPRRAPAGGGWRRGLWAACGLLLLLCGLGSWHRSGLTAAAVHPQPGVLPPSLARFAATAAVTGVTLSPSVAQAALPFDLTMPDPPALLQNFPAGLPQVPQAPALDFLKKGNEDWSYSRFIRAVEANQVVKVVVNAEATRAEFTTRDGITGTVTLLNSPKLFLLLTSHDVEVLVAESNAGPPAWLGNAVGVIVLLAVLGAGAGLLSKFSFAKVESLDELLQELEDDGKRRRSKGKQKDKDKGKDKDKDKDKDKEEEPASPAKAFTEWLKDRKKELKEGMEELKQEVKESNQEARYAAMKEVHQKMKGDLAKDLEKYNQYKARGGEPDPVKERVLDLLGKSDAIFTYLEAQKHGTDQTKEGAAGSDEDIERAIMDWFKAFEELTGDVPADMRWLARGTMNRDRLKDLEEYASYKASGGEPIPLKEHELGIARNLGIVVGEKSPPQQTTATEKPKAAPTAVSTPSAETAHGATETRTRNTAENPDMPGMEAAAAVLSDMFRTAQERIAQEHGKSESEATVDALKETIQTVQEMFAQRLEKSDPETVALKEKIRTMQETFVQKFQEHSELETDEEDDTEAEERFLLDLLEDMEEEMMDMPADQYGNYRDKLLKEDPELVDEITEYVRLKASEGKLDPMAERMLSVLTKLKISVNFQLPKQQTVVTEKPEAATAAPTASAETVRGATQTPPRSTEDNVERPSAAKANGGGSDADKELERRKADCLKMVEMFEAVWPVVPADQRKEMPRMVAAKFPDLLKDLPKYARHKANGGEPDLVKDRLLSMMRMVGLDVGDGLPVQQTTEKAQAAAAAAMLRKENTRDKVGALPSKPNNATPRDEVERLLRGLERLERLLKAAPPDRVAGLRSRLRALSGSVYADLVEYNRCKAHLKEPHPLMERLRGALERLGGFWSTGNRPVPLQTPAPEEPKAASTAVSTPSTETARGATETLTRNTEDNPQRGLPQQETPTVALRPEPAPARYRGFGRPKRGAAGGGAPPDAERRRQLSPPAATQPSTAKTNEGGPDTGKKFSKQQTDLAQMLAKLEEGVTEDEKEQMRGTVTMFPALLTELKEYPRRKANGGELDPVMESLMSLARKLGLEVGDEPPVQQTTEKGSKDEDKGDEPDADVRMLSVTAWLEGALKATPQEETEDVSSNDTQQAQVTFESGKDNATAEPNQTISDVPPGLPDVRNVTGALKEDEKTEPNVRKEAGLPAIETKVKAKKAKEAKTKADSDSDSDSDSDEEGLLGLLRKLDRVVKEEEDEVASLAKPPAKLQVVPKTGVTFGDVAGAEEAKARLQEVVDFLKAPDKYTQFGARIPRGVLLTGSPGTGKTLLAKAVAGEAGVPFISVSGSEFVEVYGGLGAARVRNLFKLANANTPCIVFIDEIDGVGRARGTGLGQTNDEKEQTLNQLLVGMDGFQPNSGIVILGATNRPDILDPALTRAGRFDRQIVVELPDLRARRAILQVHTRTKPVAAAVSLDALAQQTPGLSGADLANVMNEAAILAARRDRLVIGPEEVEDALDRVVAGMAGNPLKTGKAKELIAYHEVGHAICSTLTPGHDPVKKVTLIPRGQAQGLTWFTPTDELNLLTRQQVFAAIVGALGGRAAEEVVYGRMETTSGAAGDLQQVTRLARAMVMHFGFSDLGPWNLSERGDSSQDVILRLMARERMSEKLAADIDRRVRSIVAEAYNVAKTQLITHREALDVLAAQLLEAETLSGEDLRATLSRYATIPEDHLQAVQALRQEPLLPTRAVS